MISGVIDKMMVVLRPQVSYVRSICRGYYFHRTCKYVREPLKCFLFIPISISEFSSLTKSHVYTVILSHRVFCRRPRSIFSKGRRGPLSLLLSTWLLTRVPSTNLLFKTALFSTMSLRRSLCISSSRTRFQYPLYFDVKTLRTVALCRVSDSKGVPYCQRAEFSRLTCDSRVAVLPLYICISRCQPL